jgi:hypothetical protein
LAFRRHPARSRLLAVLAVSAVVGFGPRVQVAGAATFNVTNCNDSGAGSLRDAVSNAASGETITFALSPSCSVITETSGRITVATNLTIDGPGASQLAVSGNLGDTVFGVDPGVTAAISGLTIENGSSGIGGGIFNHGALTVTGSTLSDNTSGNGGGIFNYPEGTLTVTDSTFSNNNGSAITNDGVMTVTDIVSDNGGGLANLGNNCTMTVIDSTMANNKGSGLWNNSGCVAAVTGSVFSGNLGTNNFGGGIDNGGTLTVSDSTISSNNVGGGGGGISNGSSGFNGGTLTLTDSTVSGNMAQYGGGIYNGGGTLTVADDTLSGNSASGAGSFGVGGGIDNSGGATTVMHSTVSGNTAASGYGGGIYNSPPSPFFPPASIALVATIVANSGSGLDCAGTGISDNRYNLDDDGSCGFISPSLSRTPAGLAPSLANNGGPTLTLALEPGSAAAAAVTDPSDCAGADQRGVSWLTPCNIGAVGNTAPPPDFSLGGIASTTVGVGGSASTTVTVNSLSGFSSAVTLGASGAPSGVSTSFSPNPVTPPTGGSASSTLGLNVAPFVTPGTFTLTVTGSSGSLAHSTSAAVTVASSASGLASVINELLAAGCINNSGVANALLSKLSAAQNAISAGNLNTAINILMASIDQMNAQQGKHIASSCTVAGVTFNPATALVTDARSLINSLEVAANPDPITGSVVNGAGSSVAGATVSLLNSSGGTLATAPTDITGFYFFATTGLLNSGTTYSVKVTGLPAGYVAASPGVETFTWSGGAITLGNFTLG